MNLSTPRSPARRRLGKGMLASPVVLASVTSKNALAANYLCAVSGRMSGNASRGDASTEDCSAMGDGLVEWQSAMAISLEALPVFLPRYKGKIQDTTALRASIAQPDGDGWGDANCHHLLSGKDGPSDLVPKPIPTAELDLAVKALCVYLNARKYGTNYHIRMSDAELLYLHASTNTDWVQTPSRSWTGAECAAHIDALFSL